MKSKKRLFLFVLVGIIVLTACFFVYKNIRQNMICEALVGQTFVGCFDDAYDSEIMTITFINKTFCYIEIEDEMGRGTVEPSMSYYKINQNLFSTEFNWEYAGPGGCTGSEKPFTVRKEGDEWVLETAKYDSDSQYNSIRLEKAKVKPWEQE